MVRFTDQSVLHFGMYKDQKLKNIPASYLLHLLTFPKLLDELREYIEANKEALELEKKRQLKQQYR